MSTTHKVKTFAFHGLNAKHVDVEVHISKGLPGFTIVGLVDKVINESRERVRTAIAALGLSISDKKILVNLSPAGLVKEGSHFDLPIACCVLCALGVLDQYDLEHYAIVGELSLDSSVHATTGILLAAIEANAENLGIICSEKCGMEAQWSGNKQILLVKDLISLINHFKGTQVIGTKQYDIALDPPAYPDFAEVKGQENVKRALQVAAAGGHSILMNGPPGAGKTMLASRFCGILPPMTNQEMLECTMVYSAAGKLEGGKLMTSRPFRNPHHSSTVPAIIGGGSGNRVEPGEVSLAHNGVLLLDELPEFNRQVIDSLRQPIEENRVQISRANFKVEYPTNFQLIGTMNPCKCGYGDDPARACSKYPKCAKDYQNKISGPMLDRFDIYLEVPIMEIWSPKESKASSKELAAVVELARNKQSDRYEGYAITKNAEMTAQMITDHITVTNDAMSVLNKYAEKNKISARSYNNILKIAKTIADMDNERFVNIAHISESISYRKID